MHAAPQTSAALPVFTLRACQLCDHHVEQADGELHCACPRVAGSGRQIPCEAARRRHGGCGPDATHMQWVAIELPTQRPALPSWQPQFAQTP